jgi:hypothetical protein
LVVVDDRVKGRREKATQKKREREGMAGSKRRRDSF